MAASTRVKKVRVLPRWWVRALLYVAVYPRDEFYDYRIEMQKDFLRARRKGKANELKWSIAQAKQWSKPAALRIAWAIMGIVLKSA